MSDIVKTNGAAVAVVRASSQIIKALDSPQVTIADPREIFNVLNMAITRAYIDSGSKAPEGKVSIGNGPDDFIDLYSTMVNDLVLWVRMKRGSLRVNEIPIAIANGVEGEAGEYFGLNKRTFQQFLTYYCNSQDRKLKLAAHIAANGEPREVPSYEAQFNAAKGNVLAAFDRYKKDSDIDRFGGPVYNFMFELGLITYDEEANKNIYEAAKIRVIGDAKLKKANASDMFARDAIRLSMEAMQANNIQSGSDEHIAIYAKAKNLTIRKYFDDIILSGSNIEDLVESKRPVFYKLLADRSNQSEQPK